ncbi:MAG: neutral/alkaline ceramidase [Psychrobacter sp.]|nr:neutral/alkaline ceramidase [Psychrobacter sp.]
MTLTALTVSCAALLLGCAEDNSAATSTDKPVAMAQNYSDTQVQQQTVYNLGAGIADITGEAAESNMFGYADSDQISSGIQQRQHARAFLIGDGEREILMVVLDTGAMTQALHQAIIKQLKAHYPGRFGEDNVMITATHTHSAPGGISHYTLYGLTTRGFQGPTFDAMLNGTLRAIDRAVASEAPGQLSFGTNQLFNAGVQRSRTAYVNNPEARDNPDGIDPLMQVIRFEKDGKDIAAINWFAVHPTSLTSKNTLVSGDNKGYAAWYWETQKGIDYLTGKGFVAAFANSNPGDISPNLNLRPGSGPTEDQWQNAQILGQRQADAAINTPMTKTVSGKIDYRQTYIDMSQQMIDAKYTVDGQPHRTCPAAYKSAFAAGSEEDGGGGVGLAEAGIANEGKNNVLLKGFGQLIFMPSKDLIACQETDQVTVTMGTTKPYPMTPEIMPVQLMRVGDLAIISLPSEFTITAGLRLRKLVAQRLELPLDQVIFAGYANAYAGYNVTPEEYKRQDYEAASTHFGPHTLEAWLQNVDKLAEAMVEGKPVAKGPTPRDLSAKQISIAPGVVHDLAPLGKNFGDIAKPPQMSYQRGERAEAVFWSAHPKSTLAYELKKDRAGGRDSEPYTMAVQYNDGTGWRTIATDNDWNTTNQWQRVLAAQSRAKLTWDIPEDAATGQYRFYHHGAYKKIFSGELIPFEGYSQSFEVL